NSGGPTPTFTEHVIATVQGAWAVDAADIDGDGDMDVAAGIDVANQFVWYENDGMNPPGFTAHVLMMGAVTPRSVRAVDVNGDGHVDVLGASFGDDSIRLFLNDGAATPGFTIMTLTNAADEAWHVSAGDVDGDMDLDVLSASVADDTLRVFLNDGQLVPGFTEVILSSNAPGAVDLKTADIDSDGDNDLLAATFFDDVIQWYENTGAPIPTWPRRLIATSASGAIAVDSADLDGDMRTDIVSASSGDSKIAWYANTGAPREVYEEQIIDDMVDGVSSLFATDLDDDGDIDLISTPFNGIVWHEHLGTTPPTFARNNITTMVNGAAGVVAADYDDDGDLDILAADVFENLIRIFVSDGMVNPSFSETQLEPTTLGPLVIVPVDLNSDGDLDLALASFFDAGISWFDSNGMKGNDLDFTERIIDTADTPFERATAMTAADMNEDGRPDLVAALREPDQVVWYKNNGGVTPGFTRFTVSTDAAGVRSVQVVDLDGDGDMDVLASLSGPGEFVWYESTGGFNPTYTRHVIGRLKYVAWSATAADIDGDGDMDVIGASDGDNRVTFFENVGGSPLEFRESRVSIEALAARAAISVDIDNDGVLEILAASRNDDTVSWFEKVFDACSGDIDGDGSVNSSDLAFLLGSWGAAPGNPSDFNGDGVVNAADLANLLGGWGACP
ncbi:MAG: FG-GAP-like repeat-containing protein, partial [Planctomycetota bacterium]|nr:FG-GAP-like repeat-containing protein [Planctomycetota bacterium]